MIYVYDIISSLYVSRGQWSSGSATMRMRPKTIENKFFNLPRDMVINNVDRN